MNQYDIAVLGAGPGGYVAAIRAAQLGKKVCIIEKEHFGGVCLNKGCIPTKTLLQSVKALKEVKTSMQFGVINVDPENATLDMQKVQERKKKIVTQLTSGVQGLLIKNRVTIINSEAFFIDQNTLCAGEEIIKADHIIIATGSESKSLPVPTDPRAVLLTSTEILDLNEVPESLAVIGGGVIGVELAFFLASLGTKVTIIEFLDRILPMIDEEITAQVMLLLKKMGIEIHTGAKVTEILEKGVTVDKDGVEQSLNCENVLVSVGRVPNIGNINLNAAGVVTEKGSIITDEYLRTNVPGIYAIGDVNGKSMLAHTASMEGIIAVENICGHHIAMDYDRIPSAVYIQPEISSVGLTEKQAKEKYGQVKIGKFPLMANGKATVAGENTGFVKVIAKPDGGEIIGLHMFCINATDMISEAVAAMNLGGTVEELSMAVHPHPTISEVLQEAFHAATGKAIHY